MKMTTITEAAFAAISVTDKATNAAEVAQYLYDNFGADIMSITSTNYGASTIHVIEHPFLRDLGQVTVTPHNDRIKLQVTFRGVIVFCLAKEYA
jgi:hypothetical protein